MAFGHGVTRIFSNRVVCDADKRIDSLVPESVPPSRLWTYHQPPTAALIARGTSDFLRKNNKTASPAVRK